MVDKTQKLKQAIIIGDEATIRNLVKEGADVNAKDDMGWSPLHYAARTRRLEIALLLLKLGAHPDSREGNGRTALKVASERYGEYSAIACLLRGSNKQRARRLLEAMDKKK